MPTITGEVLRHFRDRTDTIRVPRRLRALQGMIYDAAAELEQHEGRAARPSEIAQRLGVDLEKVIEGLAAKGAGHTYSLDEPNRSPDGPGDRLRFGSALKLHEAKFELIEHRQALGPLLAALPDRERHILALRFFDGLTQSEIGARLGITQMHVSRLLTRTLDRLRRQLSADRPVARAAGHRRPTPTACREIANPGPGHPAHRARAGSCRAGRGPGPQRRRSRGADVRRWPLGGSGGRQLNMRDLPAATGRFGRPRSRNEGVKTGSRHGGPRRFPHEFVCRDAPAGVHRRGRRPPSGRRARPWVVIPLVVFEIGLGLVLGPAVLGWATVDSSVDLLADFGLSALFLLAGLEIDFARVGGRVLRRSLLGWVLALAVATGIGMLLAHRVAAGVYVGVALTSTALGTILPVLRDTDDLHTPFGTAVIGIGAVGEFGPLIAISLFLSGRRPGIAAVVLLAFVVVAVVAITVSTHGTHRGLHRMIRTTLHTSGQFAVRFVVFLLAALVTLSAAFAARHAPRCLHRRRGGAACCSAARPTRTGDSSRPSSKPWGSGSSCPSSSSPRVSGSIWPR